MARRDPVDPIEAELQAERAAALGRTAQKMETAIAALRAHDAAHPRVFAGDAERVQRDELRAEAAEWVWFYIVQREAIGFTDHREALRLYDVPEELVQRMGPRKRA